MASQVEICNRALLKLGADTITSLTDSSTSARTMASIWDTVRRAELRKNTWNFARTRTTLAKLGTTPAFQFSNQYQLPVDFLRLIQVGDVYVAPGLMDYRNTDDSPYAIEGTQLLTDFNAPLDMRYVRDVTDTGTFDALFVEAMAAKLAYESCYRITQSRQGCDQVAADYKQALKDARLVNAIELPPQGLADDSWMLVRT